MRVTREVRENALTCCPRIMIPVETPALGCERDSGTGRAAEGECDAGGTGGAALPLASALGGLQHLRGRPGLDDRGRDPRDPLSPVPRLFARDNKKRWAASYDGLVSFALGGVVLLILALLVWNDVGGLTQFLARSWNNIGKPMSPQPDPSPRYVTWTRYSTSALLFLSGVLCLWASFSPPS